MEPGAGFENGLVAYSFLLYAILRVLLVLIHTETQWWLYIIPIYAVMRLALPSSHEITQESMKDLIDDQVNSS